jgi:hypothetical protein
MKKDNNKKPEIYGLDKAFLSWKQEDYIKANEEIPDKLLHDKLHSEGELMSEEEIAGWITDTQKTFSIIKEKNPEVFNKLYQGYILDLEYLVRIGKITEDMMDEILKMENFEF